MTADDLTKEQLQKLADDTHRCRGYYHRLAARMQQQGFSQADPLLLLTLDAEKAAALLWLALHYRACGVHRAGLNEHEPKFAKPNRD